MALPTGQFLMWRQGHPAHGDPWGVHCLLGAERPRVIRGYGGWGQIAREGRRAATTFTGTETPAYSIMLRITRAARRVEETMRRLERLAGWDLVDDTPGPVVQWIANVEHDQEASPRTEWVVESLEWGESSATDSGVLLWQLATIVVAVNLETTIPGLGSATAFPRRELHRGWDLRDFARAYLGDPRRWRDVAALNRDNPACPQTPTFKPARSVWLLTPLREPAARRASRGRS